MVPELCADAYYVDGALTCPDCLPSDAIEVQAADADALADERWPDWADRPVPLHCSRCGAVI